MQTAVARWVGFLFVAYALQAANADLLIWKPSILERYYSRELLSSDLARRTFVMPDRRI